MHRVLILLFLAIAGTAFAVDSSDTILQAKNIADTSVTLQWSPMEGATSYKVSYDESSLLATSGTKPLFDSEKVTKTEVLIPDLTPATEYTFFVHWFIGEKDIGVSLPVHVQTFHTSWFTLSGAPVVVDDTTIQISFTRPIDVKKAQISLTNSVTKAQAAIAHVENSKEDLRILSIVTKKKLELGVAYNLVLKKIFTQAGTELSADNKTPLTVVYSGDGVVTLPAVPIASQPTTMPVIAPPEEKTFTEPVPIDSLPKTGSEEMILLFLIAVLSAFFIQKKLHKGA